MDYLLSYKPIEKHYHKTLERKEEYTMSHNIISSKHDDEPMGYVYINESFSSDSGIKNIDASHRADLFFVTFDTNLQDFDVENRNKRFYDASNIMDCIHTEKIQSLLRTGGWFGEFDHPAPEKAGEKLSPERIQNVPPEKRAFKIMNPKLVGNVLTARIQSAQGAVGEGFGKEVLAGWIPQFSCRAIANMISKCGKPYVQVKRLITYDAPWYPSHAIAHATSAPQVTTKSFTESVNECIENAVDKINGIMIPLKEILQEVGRTDVNAGLILEAFDLSIDNLCGFDENKNHVIIRNVDNVIYANINPDTVKKVQDFYSSF